MNTPLTPEALEALLLDRSLGELSREASELLDLYLAAHPEASADAASCARTVASARAAVALPRLLPGELPARRVPRPAMLWFPRLLPLAACLTLGLFGGWWFAQRPAPPHAGLARGAAPSSLGRSAEKASAATSSFWSAERLAARHRESAPRTPFAPRAMWELRPLGASHVP
jgi:hypothetical protein